MLFFLVSFLSFILLSKSLLFPKRHPNSKTHSRMWDFWKALQRFFTFLSNKRRGFFISVFKTPKSSTSILSARTLGGVEDEVNKEARMGEKGLGLPLLDLPDLALDCILEKLLPAELCSMSAVCTSLRERCSSDHLWESYLRQKWGRIIGDVALKEWQSQIPPKFLHSRARKHNFLLSALLDLFGHKSNIENDPQCCPPLNTAKSCYLALESGKFWFPAQVFNRENGHVGFMLSCYDARLSYDSTRDNFVARYPAQGRSVIEQGIIWSRIRAPSLDTPANILHVSKCLDELKPDDHIEIQWRKNKEFPYGWWYGVVAHLQSCGGNQFNCLCQFNDTIVLEFKQYCVGSRWRRVRVSRKDHEEVGDETGGFYGGIRKLCRKQEIDEWKHFWPNCTLE